RRRAGDVLKQARFAAAALAATAVAACSWIAGVSGDVEIVGAPDAAPGDDGPRHDAPKPDRAGHTRSEADADPTKEAPAQPSQSPDGGRPPDASTVFCARTPCTDKEQVCCYTQFQQTCQAASGPSCTGWTARCDEASDCDAGQVCCVISVHSYGLETACKTTCDTAQAQACRVNSECPSHDCVPWACAKGIAETCAGAGADAGCTP